MMQFKIEKNKLDESVKKSFNDFSKDKFNATIEVGIFADQDSEMVVIGATNEFGTFIAGRNHNIRIPERSFLRSALRKYKDQIDQFIEIQKQRYIEGKVNKSEMLNAIGLFLQNRVQQQILTNIPPKNAESTIKRKKSSKTLIDTGRLLQSITYKIIENNKDA